jgi:serine/threonine protein phosphatase PrpC
MAKKPSPSPSRFKSFAGSDQGVRGNNEDEVYADDDRGIYFVIDGMGGHAAGEQAARIAKERLLGRLGRATGSPQQRIREAIALANNAIFEAGESRPDWNGMACVLTVALLSADTRSATIGHVGDSRLYKILAPSLDEITFDKITRDHSPVGELEDGRQLSEAEAMAHPRRNEVFRDVGSDRHDPGDENFIDVYDISVEADSALLICSDGLTDAMPIAGIRGIIRGNLKDPSAAVRALISQAIKEGGKDNISVVLVQGPEFGKARRSASPRMEVVPIRPPREEAQIVTEVPTPLWRRIAFPLLWMALGAAAFFAAEQATNVWLKTQTPVQGPPNPIRRPQRILVDAKQPGAQPTIAAALSAAADGDTIELAPGIYDEPVKIDKSILFEGSGALLRPKPTRDGVDGITIAGATSVTIRNLRISGDADGDLLTGIHIIDSQVILHNVHVVDAAGPGIDASGNSTIDIDAASIRDCSGPGMLLRGAVSATVKHSAIVGNGRDPKDRQPGILIDSPEAPVLIGNTIANNGGPAISEPDPPSPETLSQNLFSLDGRKGRLEDVRVVRKRAPK